MQVQILPPRLKKGETMKYCEDCGCKTYNGVCVNCHEEVYIADQYRDLGESVPKVISDKELEHYKKVKE